MSKGLSILVGVLLLLCGGTIHYLTTSSSEVESEWLGFLAGFAVGLGACIVFLALTNKLKKVDKAE